MSPIFTWSPSAVAPTGNSQDFIGLGGFAWSDDLDSVVAALAQYIADTDPTGVVVVRNILPRLPQ